MRPSFGGGGGRGMGGGGNIVRIVGRSVTRTGVGIQEPFPASTNAANSAAVASSAPTSPRTASGHTHNLSSKNQLALFSAPSSPFGVPVSTASPAWPPFSSPQYEEYEWVSAEGSEDERSFDDLSLGSVPSTDEVHTAVSAIQRVFDSTAYPLFTGDRFGTNSDSDKDITAFGLLHRVSSTELDLDWREPPVNLANSRSLQHCGPEMVIDAFHRLQNDPSIQRMVVSLSTDRAVWEAVLNNEAVRELRESCHSAEISTLSDGTSEENSNEANPLVDIVRQMFDHTKAKFTEVIEKIAKLMYDLFEPPPPVTSVAGKDGVEGASDPFEGKLRASFMLSMMVLLIVVVSRARGA